MYRRMLKLAGSAVELRRGSGDNASRCTLKAKLAGYKPQELTGEVQQGDTKVIFMAEDVAAFPLPIKAKSTDAIYLDGRKMTVQAVDDMTRRVGGESIAYELRVRG